MTPFQTVSLIIFGVVAYMMLVDENVGIYLTLVFKMIKVNFERIFWMIRLHPNNPITNLKKKWEYDKIAKELMEELNVSVQSQENNQDH
jgi:hypothetical protein